jgi:hypothetical protein
MNSLIQEKVASKKPVGTDEINVQVPAETSSPAARQRLSITLSYKSTDAFNWLKEATDADTDSEVVRNALRLHYALLKRHSDGSKFFVLEPGASDPTAIDLFHTA